MDAHGENAMKALAVLAILAALTAPAHAQGINLLGDKPKDYAAEEKRLEQERAYKAATKQIPDQKPAANDPWGNVRGTNEVTGTKPRAR
jgi:hypothetical protein